MLVVHMEEGFDGTNAKKEFGSRVHMESNWLGIASSKIHID